MSMLPKTSEEMLNELKRLSKHGDSRDFLAKTMPKYAFMQVRPGFNALIEAIIHISQLDREDQEELVKLLNES